MAFDWTKVAGYREDMTAEEKVELLKGFEFEPPHPGEGYVAKKLYDTAASDLAAVKKQLKDRMTAEEAAQAERDAADKALRDELATLRFERAVSNFKAKLLEAKYSAEDADKLAKAAAEGKMDVFMDAIASANASVEKSLRTEILKDTPRPGAGAGTTAVDKATEIAQGIAKDVAAANKTANDALSHYM
jgi:hypothetical protein